MRKLTSCGVLCFHKNQFLLMKRAHRYDLPKGHLYETESEIECALRHLQEETGIRADAIQLDHGFRFVITYFPLYDQYPNELVEKTTVIFVARTTAEPTIELSAEHVGYEWIDWNPPHIIERETINGLMAAIEQYYGAQGNPIQWHFQAASRDEGNFPTA